MNGAALVLRILDLEEKLAQAPNYRVYTNGDAHPLAVSRVKLDTAKRLLKRNENGAGVERGMLWIASAEYYYGCWLCYKDDLGAA